MLSFAIQKHLSFIMSNLLSFLLCAFIMGVILRKSVCYPQIVCSSMSLRLFPTFSSDKFSESSFILRSLTYLELSFVQMIGMDLFGFFSMQVSGLPSTISKGSSLC